MTILRRKDNRKMIQDVFDNAKKSCDQMGWSTHELARRTGIAQPIIYRLFKGLDSVKKLDEYVDAFATALAVDRHRLEGRYESIAHLPKELQEFVANPANESWLKKAYLEKNLAD